MKKSAFDIHNQNTNTDSKIIASLERIAQAFRVLLWNESKEFSLSPIQIQVLIFLFTILIRERLAFWLENLICRRPRSVRQSKYWNKKN